MEFPYKRDEIDWLIAAAREVAAARDPQELRTALEVLDAAAHTFCVQVDGRWAGVIEAYGDAEHPDEDPAEVSPALRHAIGKYKEALRSGWLHHDDPSPVPLSSPEGQALEDPLIIRPTTEIQVAMLPGHALAYQRWLHFGGLYLFKIPGVDQDLPTYGVGIRAGDSE